MSCFGLIEENMKLSHIHLAVTRSFQFLFALTSSVGGPSGAKKLFYLCHLVGILGALVGAFSLK